jgi:hypothetical protein
LVVGLSSYCERVVYAMEIAEVVGFREYWNDRRFRAKRPRWSAKDPKVKLGDNCYRPLPGSAFKPLPSQHHQDGLNRAAMRKDLSVDRVLIGQRFAYFGANSIPLPGELRFLEIGQGHRSRFTPRRVDAVAMWFRQLPQGRHGQPALLPVGSADKEACRPQRRRCESSPGC